MRKLNKIRYEMGKINTKIRFEIRKRYKIRFETGKDYKMRCDLSYNYVLRKRSKKRYDIC